MKKYYLISLATGLIMLFTLQLLSYLNFLLLEQGVMNGFLDKTLLLKTPLIIIPLIFIAFSIVGLIIDYLHHKK